MKVFNVNFEKVVVTWWRSGWKSKTACSKPADTKKEKLTVKMRLLNVDWEIWVYFVNKSQWRVVTSNATSTPNMSILNKTPNQLKSSHPACNRIIIKLSIFNNEYSEGRTQVSPAGNHSFSGQVWGLGYTTQMSLVHLQS